MFTAFYENLQKIINNASKSDMLLLMGDFSARVGNIPINSNVRRFGETTRNRNGTRLIDSSA
jgi:hypothetical protein